jgi:hypothetical protein
MAHGARCKAFGIPRTAHDSWYSAVVLKYKVKGNSSMLKGERIKVKGERSKDKGDGAGAPVDSS